MIAVASLAAPTRRPQAVPSARPFLACHPGTDPNASMSRETLTTDFQLIGTWLGLPPGSWPPDHYTLLGLPPCESNVVRIEQTVHERLMRVRSYQLSHPTQATEAMMRLAKAFDCLTCAAAKKAYDQAHFPQLAPRPALP